MLLNNQWVKEEIKREKEKISKTNTMKYNIPKHVGCSKSNPKREVHNNKCLPQETRKISNKQPNLTSQGTSEKNKTKQNPKLIA